MKHCASILLAALASLTIATAPAFAASTPERSTDGTDPLTTTVAALDSAMFDAFNECSDPAQLARHAAYFAPDVEFYHDNGGVTWTRDAMIANTKQHACGTYRRELVPGTLEVFAIKGFGALARGTHTFCQVGSGDCEGKADFVLLWREKDGGWQVTRSFSFGHRAND